MLFLKSLLFIVWNIALGSLLVYSLKWFLFNPKPIRLFGKKLPLTPGFLVRKREWLFNQSRDLLQGYLNQAANTMAKNGYLFKWESQVWQAVWDQTMFIDEWILLPKGLKQKLHASVSTAAKGLASKLLRKTVPHFIEQWRIEYRIDEFDEQFNMEFFYSYFRKYVYKPLLLAFLAVNLIIGILNMVLFLILA